MLDFSKLTPTNGAVESLRELINLTTFHDEDLEKVVTVLANQKHGKKVGFIGEMDDVGTAGANCNPTYKNAKIQSAQKEWELGEWEIPLKICYKDLKDTIAQYTLKAGTNIADLTSGEYMSEIIEPKLKDAIMRMLWRLSWYGDKTASSSALTSGVDPELFKTCDGFWKRLMAIGAASDGQKTTIAANNETTAALQYSKIREKGVATGIFDNILFDADSRIGDMPGAGVFCSKSMADALAYDVREKYNAIMPWTVLFEGLEVSEWNSVKVYKLSAFDRYTKKYQNNGTKINLPHRAVYTAPSNLLLGHTGINALDELSIWFDQTTRLNHIYSTGEMGTLIHEDDLVQVAY